MKPRERVMCALAGDQPDRVPFCEGGVAEPVIRAMANGDHELSEREMSDVLGRDVVFVMAFPPYFADTQATSSGQSYVTSGWIKSRADLDRMVFPDPQDPALYQAAERLLAQKGDYAAAAGIKLGVAPMFISMGLDGFSYALRDDPGLIQEVLRRYVEWQLPVTEHLIRMGFDMLWAYDDLAFKSGPFCRLAAFREFLLPAMRRSAEAITVPWIYHSDGNIMPLLDDLLTLGMSAIHPIEPGAMDLAEVKREYGRRVCIIGNVSIDTLGEGTTAQVTQTVRDCIRIAGPGGGYMISSSNSIPPYARPENVRAMADAIHEYGAYPISV